MIIASLADCFYLNLFLCFICYLLNLFLVCGNSSKEISFSLPLSLSLHILHISASDSASQWIQSPHRADMLIDRQSHEFHIYLHLNLCFGQQIGEKQMFQSITKTDFNLIHSVNRSMPHKLTTEMNERTSLLIFDAHVNQL